jgi:hypothetical protein
MKKFLLLTVAALAALTLNACVGKEPFLIGKGKGVPPAPPPIVTKG